MPLPHEVYPWIAADGSVGPGTFTFPTTTESLTIPSGYVVRGRGPLLTTIVSPSTTHNAVNLSGGLVGVSILGGNLGVNIPNGTTGAFLTDAWVSGQAVIPVWVGTCTGARIARLLVVDSNDNGIQLEGPSDCEVISSAFVGNFGNKAVDCSHGTPANVRILHLTVVATHGYGIGLIAWHPGAGHVLGNCAIYKPPQIGSFQVAVHMPNGPSCADFFGNVVLGELAEAGGPVAGFDVSGVLAEDLPKWSNTGLAMIERLRVARTRRMFSAKPRPFSSYDLEGRPRQPCRNPLASGAIEAPAL